MTLTQKEIEKSENIRGLAEDLQVSLPEAARLMEISDDLASKGIAEMEALRILRRELIQLGLKRAGGSIDSNFLFNLPAEDDDE